MNEVILTGKMVKGSLKITSRLQSNAKYKEFTLVFTSTNVTGITRKHYIDVVRKISSYDKRFSEFDDIEVIGSLQDCTVEAGGKKFYVYARNIEVLTSNLDTQQRMIKDLILSLGEGTND